MKVSSSIALLSALAIGSVKANFDIYEVRFGGTGIGGNGKGWLTLNADADCEAIKNTPFWPEKDDLNGKHGFRPEYSGDNLSELEMNFSNVWHYTWYADRPDGALYGLNGESMGKCYLFPLEEQYCSNEVGQIIGERVMRCETDLTPEQLNSVHPN